MLKISTKSSVTLSICISALLFILIIAGAFILPPFVDKAFDIKGGDLSSSMLVAKSDYIFILSLGYAVLAVISVINAFLLALLLRVRVGLIFTDKSISLIRMISWCALLLGVIFLVLGIYFLVSYFVGFMCIFIGICIRVVKNVIEEATEIKNENDYTI